jgi:protein gp37
MSDRSSIQWTQATWNPVTGCVQVSPGCDHCYAKTFAERFRGVKGHPYEQGFDLKLWPERLEIPKRWRAPRLVFVNSMSDLFQDGVPIDFVRRVWETMAATPRHTYQVLTKRPGVMASMLRRVAPDPLPNVWLGTSVEDQKRADLRIRKLLETPAAIRFLSCEPLLGPIDVARAIPVAPLTPEDALHWVIVGGESGPGARPMELEWARSLVNQCKAADIACFVKQLGSPWAHAHRSADSKGGEISEWPRALRVRQMPDQSSRRSLALVNSVG